MSMFPHTITVYNVEILTDKETFKDVIVNHTTVLDGVLVSATSAINRSRASSPEDADSVSVYIPFGVKAFDGITGAEKHYVGPSEFWAMEDKSNYWTLSFNDTKQAGTTGFCFLIKGNVVENKAFSEIKAEHDGVYTITAVDIRDFGSLKHFEVSGK